jgi:Arc/MetJ-type ribon-helix-helix transcriptional regulator
MRMRAKKPKPSGTPHTTVRLNDSDRSAIEELLKLTGLASTSEAIRLAIRETVARWRKKL